MNSLPPAAMQDILNLRNSIKVFRELGHFDEDTETYHLNEYSMIFSKIAEHSIFKIYLDDVEAIEYTKMDRFYCTSVKNEQASNVYLCFLESKLLEMELPNHNTETVVRRFKI